MFSVFLYLETEMEKSNKGRSNGGSWITTYQKLAEIENNSASICKIVAKYNIPESNLQNRQDMSKRGVVLIGPGKKTVLTFEGEKQLTKCIGELCSLGFSPTIGQVIDLVEDYVTLHKLNTP